MKHYSVAVLTKSGPKERESDTLTMIKVLTNDESAILREAFKSKPLFELFLLGHRYCNHVYDEIK